MIVKNEEEVIERCLLSCHKLFDEIIIVDTGSNDKTKEICKKFTKNVYDFLWVNDFSLARNFGINKCNCEYFMWLDADDIITKENFKKLLKLKERLTDEDIVMLKYDIAFDENDNATFSYFRERIVKNNKKFYFKDPVHEVIIPSGKIIYEDISIQHRKLKENKTNRNLKIYENLLKNKVKFTARQQFYYSRELFFNNKFKKAKTNLIKFLKFKDAFIENKIEACNLLSKCYRMENDRTSAKEVLFFSFMFDLPRAENLCELGYIYKDEKDYKKAIYYFNLATKTILDKNNLGFVQKDYLNFIPYLEMCVCYYNLGDLKSSIYYNNKAKKIKPQNAIVLKNEKFFNYLKQNNN